MSQTNFSGPIETGLNSPTPTTGTVPAVKRVSVSAEGVYAPVYLPNCNIIGFSVNVETAFKATAASVIRFGTSADATFYGSIGVSAVAHREAIGLSGANLLNIASGSTLVVDVTSPTTAGEGQASVYVNYQQLS